MAKIKEFWKNNFKEILTTIFVFFMFLILFRIIPMMYDGWGAKLYYSKFDGIFPYIINIFTYYYKYLNGRISQNILSGFLESFKSEWVLDIFNALIIVGIFLCIYKILNLKDKKKKFCLAFLFYMSLILLISPDMRIQVLFYANTTYIVPIFLVLLYYLLYQKLLNNECKSDNKQIVYMSLLAFAICTWIEHIAVGFTIVLFGMTLYKFYKKDQRRFKLFFPLVMAIIGVLLMFLSPGLRGGRVLLDINFLERLIKNMSSFYIDIISNNIFIIFILALFGVIIFSKNIKGKFGNKLLVLNSLGLSILSLAKLITNNFNIKVLKNITNFIFPTDVKDANLIVIIIVTLLIIVLLLNIIINSKNKKILFYIAFIVLLSIGPMCFSPNTGPRISSVGFFGLVIILTIIYLEKFDLKLTKNLKLLAIILVIISCDKTILLERRVYEVTEKRERILKNVVAMQELGLWNYDNYVYLPLYEEGDILHRGDMSNDNFYFGQFIYAYGINVNTKIYKHEEMENEEY